MQISSLSAAFMALALIATEGLPSSAASKAAVTTYHYDTLRTGWNSSETTLTAAKFPAHFGIVAAVQLDDQVDAQPLVVPAFTTSGHDVAYVATESNTVYAIDASNGQVLLKRNLGNPVHLPQNCYNNGPNVGITSTPVIDMQSQTLYLIAYVAGTKTHPSPTYQLHALDLRTLNDKTGISPATVAASHKLTNGTTYLFNAAVQRQRPALLELNGSIYAGFGSFCDFQASQARGWVLGWNAGTLKPLSVNGLTDSQSTSMRNFYLSAVWMSGFGIAGVDTEIYLATGNSDCSDGICPPKSTWDGRTNLQESVFGATSDLTKILSIFTPVTSPNTLMLDKNDADLGSGGVMLLPQQSGAVPLLVAGGKDGRLFLFNRSSLQTPLATQQIGGCWCGPSYFVGADGTRRVVTSHAATLATWKVPSLPALVEEGTAALPASEQDRGFFTSVSSNGTAPGSAIIWAVGRPSKATGNNLTLYAFDAAANAGSLKLLYSAVAGPWPYVSGNANVVPVVANGKVLVASFKRLAIFGANSTAANSSQAAYPTTWAAGISGVHELSGLVVGRNGARLTILLRNGRRAYLAISPAIASEHLGTPLYAGVPVTALGNQFAADGSLVTTDLMRAKGTSGRLWPPDH